MPGSGGRKGQAEKVLWEVLVDRTQGDPGLEVNVCEYSLCNRERPQGREQGEKGEVMAYAKRRVLHRSGV